MKFKTALQAILVGCGVLGLVACASMHKDGADVTDADVAAAQGPDAQTAGLGGNSSFGGAGSSLAKRTYYFDYDKSDVRDSDRPAIVANANKLSANPNAKALIEGHTDPRGSREYNVALGERRANAVADLMKAQGVNPGQVRVVSYGAQRPATPGHTEEDYQQDRRAVLDGMHG